MRNIKLTETEFRYLKDCLSDGDIAMFDSWNDQYPESEANRRSEILKKALYKFCTTKKQ